MEEKKILINNLKVNFKIAGQGPVILILHGWGGSSSSWLKVQRILAKKSFLVICPDLPGFGKSQTPKEAWDVSGYVKWLTEFVESQKLDTFYLLGHSFGGRVAIKFSALYHQKVKKLILCSSGGVLHQPSFKSKIAIWLAHLGNMIFSPKPLSRVKDGARNIFYSFLRNRDYVKANGVMKEAIKKTISEDLLPQATKIETKTLIVWGKKDKMLPVRDAFIFNEKIRNSELKILAKAGHSPHLEIPQKLSEVIINFLTADS